MIIDAHFHIIDPKFPVISNQGYLPSPYTVTDYLNEIQGLDFEGGVVVSGSFQAFDQSYLLDALHRLGENYVGVTQIPSDISDQEIIELNNKGIRAVRFNLKRGGSESVEHLAKMAHRIYDLVKWHVEIYVDSAELASLKSTILSLPKVCIDHLGLTMNGYRDLLDLVAAGVKVKASGFGRVDLDVKSALQKINDVNPAALMFGSDLPATRSKRRFRVEDLELIQEIFDYKQQRKIFFHNARDFYRLNI